jgi:hypothetical protein
MILATKKKEKYLTSMDIKVITLPILDLMRLPMSPILYHKIWKIHQGSVPKTQIKAYVCMPISNTKYPFKTLESKSDL